MPFCPECGKNVGISQKFCRSCGASLIEESPAVAAPPPPPAPNLRCLSCGALLAPDEKFCGICGAKSGEVIAPAAAAPAPASVAAPVPEPVYQAPPPHQVYRPAALVCTRCGSPMTPDMKFCGTCGANGAAREAYQSPAPVYPAPPPVYQPPPPPAPEYAVPVPVTPAGDTLVCKACGNPIKPGDRFCSKCLVKVPDSVPAAARVQASPPPPVYQPPLPAVPEYAVPAPVAPAGDLRVCKACGNPIKPGDRFCSKCLVRVPDIVAAGPVVLPPPPPPAVAAPQGYVCSSCGSPVSGLEKYCGICGSAVVAARAPAPAPAPAAPPAGKFCGRCGSAISGTTKFCGTCGAAVNIISPAGGDTSFRPAPPVTTGGEEVIGVIANARKVKFLGASWDTWNIVVTSRRMIMVQMTSAMLNAAVAEAQAKAKAEGKGFFGIMKDQLSASFGYATRYETMNPDMTLAETPGNFAVENARITAINLKVKTSGSDDAEYTEFRISIESADGRHEYLMAEDDRYVNLLKQVYGDKVHMPFGYFKLGASRIKFF